MLILAILLLAAAAAACVVVALQATEPVTVDLLGTTFDTSAREVFLAGAVCGLLIALSLWLLKSSTARARRRKQEVNELKRTRRTEVERLEAEKAELQSALRNERNSAPVTPVRTTRAPADTTIDVAAHERATSTQDGASFEKKSGGSTARS